MSAERVDGLLARIEESDGPPPGVPTTGLKILHDEDQGTAVVLQYFATAEDMDAGAQAFSAMDAAETPGTRASVDMCEIKLEVDIGSQGRSARAWRVWFPIPLSIPCVRFSRTRLSDDLPGMAYAVPG